MNYKITINFQTDDGKWENSESTTVERTSIDSVADEAIARIGDWQRYAEKQVQKDKNILPE